MAIEREKGGGWKEKKSSGPPTWLRILSPISNLAAMKRGGKVQKTGKRVVHKGERVVPAKSRKKVDKAMKRSKMRMRSGR